MILADKIIRLRKKNGWTQEEFAEKMKVSRQAVSKWEGAQTIPDLEKILTMSSLFGVTTDYLLKDEMEHEEFTVDDENTSGVRTITMKDANEFLELRRDASVKIAVGTFLCIIASIPLLILGAASEMPEYNISENFAVGAGVSILLVIVAVAVILFVLSGFKSAPYEFIDKEPFETVYGVEGMVKERQKEFRNTYIKFNVIGTCICILSPVPLIMGAFLEKDFLIVCMLCITMFMAGTGVIFFITAGVRWAGMQKILQEGDYAPREKRNNSIKEAVGTIYWLIATAVYLIWSFVTNGWEYTWIVWVGAGVLYAPVICICNLINSKDK